MKCIHCGRSFKYQHRCLVEMEKRIAELEKKLNDKTFLVVEEDWPAARQYMCRSRSADDVISIDNLATIVESVLREKYDEITFKSTWTIEELRRGCLAHGYPLLYHTLNYAYEYTGEAYYDIDRL